MVATAEEATAEEAIAEEEATAAAATAEERPQDTDVPQEVMGARRLVMPEAVAVRSAWDRDQE